MSDSPGFWASALKDGKSSLLAILVCLAFVVIAGASLYVVIEFGLNLFKDRPVSVTYNGFTTIVGGRSHSYVMHSAPVVWTDSGVEVPAGHVFHISAIGRTHLAFHHLARAMQEDTVPKYPWSDADGYPYRALPGSTSALRKGLLLFPDGNVGLLLACLTNTDAARPSLEERGATCTDGIRPVGADRDVLNSARKTQKLWFAVNDMVLTDTPEARGAYLEDFPSDEGKELAAKRWTDVIVRHKYWNIWYDDNVGQLLIRVEIR